MLAKSHGGVKQHMVQCVSCYKDYLLAQSQGCLGNCNTRCSVAILLMRVYLDSSEGFNSKDNYYLGSEGLNSKNDYFRGGAVSSDCSLNLVGEIITGILYAVVRC